MTIYDFIYLSCDAGLMKVEVYDMTTERVIWSGNGDEMPTEIEDMELMSFDVPYMTDTFTLNVETEVEK